MDNVVIYQEVLHSMCQRSSSKGLMLIKVDLEKVRLLKIIELSINFFVGKQYFLVGKPITDHLPIKLFSRNFPGR